MANLPRGGRRKVLKKFEAYWDDGNEEDEGLLNCPYVTLSELMMMIVLKR